MVEIPKFPELTFDEATHLYRLNGAELPSVTTVMKPLSTEVYGGVDEWVMERAAGRGTAVPDHLRRRRAAVQLPGQERGGLPAGAGSDQLLQD